MGNQEKKPDNPSAFPFLSPQDKIMNEGMTLRDYFAAKAMLGVISNEIIREIFAKNAKIKGINGDDEIAKASYKIADAMLKQREL